MAAVFNLPADVQKLALGLMSGTSCDGLDIALVSVKGEKRETRLELIKGRNFPYSTKQQNELLKLLQPGNNDAAVLSQLNFYLAGIWAEMVLDFLEENGLSPQQIRFIGSHGQTIWHQPNDKILIDVPVTSTLQLGDPSVLAKLTGITVIGDFRVADMALGGQGAPLIPYFDWVYFSRFRKNMLAVNIGGIANLTFIPADGDINKVAAFDCGPGNILIDRFTQIYFKKPYDENGSLAKKGKLSEKLLGYLQKTDHFISVLPPKSTGREHYGIFFENKLRKFIDKNDIDIYDVLHTLTFYTAYCIWENYREFIHPVSPVKEAVISGGGACNRFLTDQIQRLFGKIAVKNTDEFGLDNDFKEAIGFAVLANETLLGNPSNIPQVTGARSATVLGKICPP
ncbi:MAG: anhydro-N-acetylmuramic acid kinase [Calditrichaeota bacterium]|nr:anhydro-N-acetylmuramic acid kinase [Calditrichota bacterium]